MARRTVYLMLVAVWLTATTALAAPDEPTIQDLAGLAPSEVAVFAAFTPRSGSAFDPAEWKGSLDAESLRQVLQAEAWLGTTLEDLFTWARPSGFGVVFSEPTASSLAALSGRGRPEIPDMALALALRDETACRRAVERFVTLRGRDLGLRALRQEGVRLWAPEGKVAGPALALEKGHLVVGTRAGVIHLSRSLGRATSGLIRDPQFQKALARVPARQGAFLYTPVRQTLSGVHPGGPMEEEFLEAARALDYLVIGEVQRGDRWTTETLARFQTRTSSPLAWPLLIPVRPSVDLAGWFPSDVAVYGSVELETFYRPVVAVVRWSGALAGPFLGGLALPVGSLAQALEPLGGRLAGAVDVGPDGGAEPTVLLAAGVNDPQGVLETAARLEGAAADQRARTSYQGCAGNITSLSSALEAYRSDNEGRYPDRLGLLVPDYLPRLPVCPSGSVDTYSEGYRLAASGECAVACRGRHHRDMGVGPDVPAYASDSGLDLPEGAPQVPPLKRESSPVHGTTVHRYADLPLRWAVGSRGAERVLLLSFGPRAEDLLGRSIQLASGGDSVAGDPAYQGLLQDSQGTVVATGLVRSRLLARTLQVGLADAPASLRELFDGFAVEDAVGYVSMESGALRSVSPTSLSSNLASSLEHLLRGLNRATRLDP